MYVHNHVHRIRSSAAEVKGLTSECFHCFPTQNLLVCAIAFLFHQASSHAPNDSTHHSCKGWHQCNKLRTPKELEVAEKLILQSVQRTVYPEEYATLQAKQAVSSSSTILSLDPYMSEGLIRVGGCLRHAPLETEVKNLIILLNKHQLLSY